MQKKLYDQEILNMDGFDHKKLRSFRRRLRYSLSEVAEISGIPKSCIFDYERGHSTPPLQRFRRLCKTYGCDAFEILELLRLSPFDSVELRRFRSVCRQEQTTPEQALIDFVQVYCSEDE